MNQSHDESQRRHTATKKARGNRCYVLGDENLVCSEEEKASESNKERHQNMIRGPRIPRASPSEWYENCNDRSYQEAVTKEVHSENSLQCRSFADMVHS